jgi:diguanylate cyclase (GGDEF)-like protein
VVVFRDVSETRRLVRKMAHDAKHDALTGLVNRREFERRAEQDLVDTRSRGRQHVVCFHDLDQFKCINDSAGHATGDEFLKQIGALMEGAFRSRVTFPLPRNATDS